MTETNDYNLTPNEEIVLIELNYVFDKMISTLNEMADSGKKFKLENEAFKFGWEHRN